MLLVVPLQTILSLFLAVLVSRAILRGRGLFRTAFYFPSVTSSVAITVLWLFLFSTAGVINEVLSWVGINGPNWFNDPRGIVHIAAGRGGAARRSRGAHQRGFLGITWWEWLAGPSVAMFAFILMAIFTTSGTFMLLFVAGAAEHRRRTRRGRDDGRRERVAAVLAHHAPPAATHAVHGADARADRLLAGVRPDLHRRRRGARRKTTLTPAYLSYQAAFQGQEWGQGSAIAFILFVIIIAFTIFQRWVLRDRPVSKRRSRQYQVKGQPPTGAAIPP